MNDIQLQQSLEVVDLKNELDGNAETSRYLHQYTCKSGQGRAYLIGEPCKDMLYVKLRIGRYCGNYHRYAEMKEV